MKTYTITYGSSSQRTSNYQSKSRNARKHGQNALGTSGGGWITVSDVHGNIISRARYTPNNGGQWYNCY